MTPLRGGRLYWADPPALPIAEPWRAPLALKLAIALGLIVWALAFVGARSLVGQEVTAVAEIRNGVGEIFVGNPTKGRLTITVQLYRDATTDGGAVMLGPMVSTLIAPASFTLQPGESQIVRLRVRESVKPGELLRVVTILDPRAAPDTAQVAQLTVVMRLVTKARVVQ